MLHVDAAPRLADLTTLRLGGACVARIRFSPGEADAVPALVTRLGGRPVPFGGGSNILAVGGEENATLLCPVCAQSPQIAGTDADGHVLARVDAGMRLSRLLAWCAHSGLSGLEGLAGVPGLVGGAIAGNAGSFGSDMAGVLRRVSVFSAEQGALDFPVEEVRAGYRHFSIPALERNAPETGNAWHVITHAFFAFKPLASGSVMANMRAAVRRKLQNQPVRAHSAGCVFKNPGSVSAGKLLEEAGFRGKRLGGMAFSAVHANFLVNAGGGTPEQALELVQQARETVLRVHGVELQPEVRIWDS